MPTPAPPQVGADGLHLCAGKLLNERMERLFESFDRHIAAKLEGGSLTDEQKLVLAYLIKSEWANEQLGYTILLIRNTFNKIEKAGFVSKVAGTRGYVLRDDFKATHML